ncbi:hypothetical protein [Prevotellamassilia timonensis]|uniref:hypothetical protein n=1 Tax=Prevotellamassilia timonensis TaxID=1852370 RepID=UPI0023EFE860|nr:hypothetical protein [Prevotellamassilia timonensis]MDD7440041.1 hypothetical protein [Prevotellamassilia timonensis]
MKYDVSNPLHREQAMERLEALLGKEHGIIELSEVKPQRSIKQNKYLHLLLGFFASEYGETIDYVKEQYFKLAANRSIFVRERDDKLAGRVSYLRSTRDLDKGEMQIAIERFRNWSSINAGIYLPSADEHRLLELAEIEISRNKNFL